MAEMNTHSADDASGSERAEIMPASMITSKTNVNAVMIQSGFNRLNPPSDTFDPKALLKSLRRRWVLASSLGLALALVVGITAVLVMPPAKYTTRSQLQVKMFAPTIIFKTQENGADYQTFKQTQIQMIKSRAVIGPALRDPKVAALPVVKAQIDPAEWLENKIEVVFPAGSELLTISMTSENPDELEPIVNAVVKAYLETVVEDEHQMRIQRLERLRKLYNRYQEDLRTKRASLRSLANTAGSEDRATLVLSQQFKLENLQVVQKELLGIQQRLRILNSAKNMIDKEKQDKEKQAATAAPSTIARPKEEPSAVVNALPDSIAIDTAVDSRLAGDTTAQNLKQQLLDAQAKYDRLKRLTRQLNDSALNAQRGALQQKRGMLSDYRARVRDAVVASLNAHPDSQNAAAGAGNGGQTGAPVTYVQRLEDQIAMAKASEADLNKEIEKQRTEVLKLNGQTIDLLGEQEDIFLLTETARKIGTEVEALDVELQAPRRISLWMPAEPARRKDITKQYLMCGGAAFGALALTMLGVSFWEMRAMRISSVDEVVRGLGLPLVGALPAIPSRTSKLSKADDQRWQGLLVESIDATRTMLLHSSRVNSTRAVMITSAMKGEGKTSLAAHLATSLARSGRKTLLIDCDLRRPRLHQLFDIPRVPGLCELLRGEAEITDVIRPTPADDLNMIPAGNCDGLSLQAIAQEGFRDILQILKKRYDFIIVDSAPVLPVVDTMLLSQQVDAVLFSIMRDVSRVPYVRAAHQRLESLGVKMLGAVVSAAERRDYMHMYDYEYQTVETD